MATTYKTPGVYVEEIPKFPPSVAPVDTAIPAFIGYTEKAIDEVADDLHLKPKRIESLVEFEQYFGGPQLETEIAVTIEETTTAAPASRSASRRPPRSPRRTARSTSSTTRCSCSTPTAAKPATSSRSARTRRRGRRPRSSAELQAGLEPLAKVDEPTLIVVPEAQALAPIADFGTLHEQLPRPVRGAARTAS